MSREGIVWSDGGVFHYDCGDGIKFIDIDNIMSHKEPLPTITFGEQREDGKYNCKVSFRDE